jgi:pilus assembly protein CpaB
MEKLKPIILLGLAVIVALVTSILIYNWLKQKGPASKDLANMETIPIVVAASDLSAGTTLTEELLKSKDIVKTAPFLKASLPAGYFSDPLSLKGRVLTTFLKFNEPILESKLASAGAFGEVAALISPKKRAMAIKVDKVIGVAGFIHPRNRVDVLVTITEGERTITKIVLQNMLVLATGTEIEKKEDGKKPTLVDVITLELTPEEAEMMALAATQGKVQLALRGFADAETVLTRGKSVPSLLTSNYPVVIDEKVIPRKKVLATGVISRKSVVASELSAEKSKTEVILIKGNGTSTLTF